MYFRHLLLLPLLLIYGCLSESNGTISTAGNGSTTTPEDTTTSTCSEGVIDRGSKGSVAAVGRGLVSDMALNPVNNREVIAYYDAGALSIKLSYWNGTQYVHETIAGAASAANSISLTLLSTGIPVVAWTSGGTDLYLAARGATLTTTSSSWSSRFFTTAAAAKRTVELKAAPNGMVGGVFYSNSTTAGRLKYIYCASQCQNISNYSIMTGSNVVGDDLASVASQLQVGFGWCGVDSNTDGTTDTFYPTVSYGRSASATSRVTLCKSATPATCLTSAGWDVNAQYVTSSNVLQTLLLDPTIDGDSIKILAQRAAATAGVRAYLSYSGGAVVKCNNLAHNSTTSFVESAVISANTFGTQWMELLKDKNGFFHAVYNNGTTAMSYANTAQTNLNNWTAAGFWNGAGTLNTATLVAGHIGGAVIHPTTNKILSTHYAAVATNRFNLMVNQIDDVSASSAVVFSTNNYVNNDGHLVLAASVANNISVNRSSRTDVGVAYVDYSAGSATTGVLKYAYRSERSITSSWSVVSVPGVPAASSPSLAFDHLDRPFIGYYNPVTFRFHLVYNSEADGTGTWTNTQMALTPTGAHVQPASNDVAVVMYHNAGVSLPVMIVLDNTNTTRGVKVARFTPTTATWSAVTTAYTITASGLSGLAAASDQSGNIFISFLDRVTASSNFLRVANSANGGTSFSTPLMMGPVAVAGQGTRVLMNSTKNEIVLSYHDRANNRLYRSVCANTPANCALGGWNTETVEAATGLSNLTNSATGNESLASSALVERSDGSYDMLYPFGSLSTGNLNRRKVNDVGELQASDIWSSGVGATLATALNFGTVGYHVDATITEDNHLVSVFVGAGNILVHKSCNLDQE